MIPERQVPFDLSYESVQDLYELQMPFGTKMKSSQGFGNILVATKPFSAGEILFRETPILTYNPKDPIFTNLGKLIGAIQNREKVCHIVNHPRAREWCMHMLAFSLAETSVKKRVMNSFFRPSRLNVLVSNNAFRAKSEEKDTVQTKAADGTCSAENQATISLLTDSIACATWLQALATSYMALATVPELAEVVASSAETLADAALVFVFSAHRFRGVPRLRPQFSSRIVQDDVCI
jgi:hypothetical protein